MKTGPDTPSHCRSCGRELDRSSAAEARKDALCLDCGGRIPRAGLEEGPACRCKESIGMTPAGILKRVAGDLMFWRRRGGSGRGRDGI